MCCWQNTGTSCTSCRERLWSLLLGDLQKLPGRGLGQPTLGGFEKGVWTKWSPEVPSSFRHSVVQLNRVVCLWYQRTEAYAAISELYQVKLDHICYKDHVKTVNCRASMLIISFFNGKVWCLWEVTFLETLLEEEQDVYTLLSLFPDNRMIARTEEP